MRERYGRGSTQAPGRRRADVERSVLDGPAAGRGRGPLRDGGLRLLGHARQQFQALKDICRCSTRASRALVEDIYAARPGSRRDGGGLGRVRPHAQDQQGRRPRSLGAGQFRTAGRRRHADRPGDRRHGQDRRLRRCTSRVHYHDVLATIYHNLGIDPHTIVKDASDRPNPILPEGARPIAEFI